MLILKAYPEDRINLIYKDITVQIVVCGIGSKKCKIGIEAPCEVEISRSEQNEKKRV